MQYVREHWNRNEFLLKHRDGLDHIVWHSGKGHNCEDLLHARLDSKLTEMGLAAPAGAVGGQAAPAGGVGGTGLLPGQAAAPDEGHQQALDALMEGVGGAVGEGSDAGGQGLIGQNNMHVRLGAQVSGAPQHQPAGREAVAAQAGAAGINHSIDALLGHGVAQTHTAGAVRGRQEQQMNFQLAKRAQAAGQADGGVYKTNGEYVTMSAGAAAPAPGHINLGELFKGVATVHCTASNVQCLALVLFPGLSGVSLRSSHLRRDTQVSCAACTDAIATTKKWFTFARCNTSQCVQTWSWASSRQSAQCRSGQRLHPSRTRLTYPKTPPWHPMWRPTAWRRRSSRVRLCHLCM